MAKKSRRSQRRGRPPSRGMMVGIGIVLVGAVILLAQNRPSLLPERGGGAGDRDAPRAAAERDGGERHDDGASPLTVDSDWDRLRLRVHSEYLRLFRGGDHAAILRLTSRTLRGALEEIGIARDRIDERPHAAAAAGARRAPVTWRIQVPPRASLFRINDAVTQAMLLLGGRVIRGAERPAQTLGTALDLRVGFGERVTHALVVEPNPAIDDADSKIAFVVTDLDRDSPTLFRSFVRSPVPFTFALRPDRPGAARDARDLREAKREIFLSLAMEPRGYPRIDPGRNAILLDLSRIEIEDRITRALSSLGPVRGVVSRMGGAAVNDADVMRAVLAELKRRDLPFLDAHGAGPSVVEEVGEQIGARTMTLGGALDGAAGSPAAARARLRQFLASASQRGAVVVSFRANAMLLTVIEAERDAWRAQGIEIVPASEVAL